MVSTKVLLEIRGEREGCFHAFDLAAESDAAAMSQARTLLDPLTGLGVDTDEDVAPVPLLSNEASLDPGLREVLHAFPGSQENPDLPAASVVIAAEVERDRLDQLAARDGVTVWPNSDLALIEGGPPWERAGPGATDAATIDAARSRAGIDCRPFRAGVDLATIRRLLGVKHVWGEG